LFCASIPVYAAALSMGYGEEDTASVCGVLQTMAGVRRDKPGKRSKRR
jgi:L-threonate 2-dehydrogenase